MKESYGQRIDKSEKPEEWEEPEEETDNPPELPEREEDHPATGKKDSTRRLTTVQIVACALVLAVAAFLRFNGGSLYQTARNWYVSAVNDSILPEEQEQNVKQTVINLWSSLVSSRANGAEQSSSPSAQSSSSKTLQGQENSSAVSQPSGSSGENSVSSAPVSSKGTQSANSGGSTSSGTPTASKSAASIVSVP